MTTRASLYLFLSALSLWSIVAPAFTEGWPDETIRIVHEQNQKRPRPTCIDLDCFELTDPFLTSLVDHLALKARGWSGYFVPGFEFVALDLRSDDFVAPNGRQQPLLAPFWPAANPNAPLTVFLPGSFQSAEDDNAARMVETLVAAGHHVLVLPNPLSRAYMMNHPTAPPGTYADEARVVRRATISLLLQRRLPTRDVRLIATSHGTILAAMAWYDDAASPQALYRQLTLVYPQRRLGASIELLDSYIAASMRGEYSPAAVVGGQFQNLLANVVDRLQLRYLSDEAAGFRARQYPPEVAARLLAYSRRQMAERLQFKDVLEAYVERPEAARVYKNGDDDVIRWVQRAHALNRNKAVRIITSDSDWTNPRGAWRGLPAWLRRPRHFLSVHLAGHGGTAAESWFREAILAATRESSSAAATAR